MYPINPFSNENQNFIQEIPFSFDSNAISKVTKYVKEKVGKKHADKFLNGLKSLLRHYDFPINKISDNDVKYLSAKKALLINPEGEIVFHNN